MLRVQTLPNFAQSTVCGRKYARHITTIPPKHKQDKRICIESQGFVRSDFSAPTDFMMYVDQRNPHEFKAKRPWALRWNVGLCITICAAITQVSVHIGNVLVNILGTKPVILLIA